MLLSERFKSAPVLEVNLCLPCKLVGYLYAVGGHDGINYLKTVERYNPETTEWTCVASMGARRGGVGVATLGGCLYATGGYDGASNLSTSGKVENLEKCPFPHNMFVWKEGIHVECCWEMVNQKKEEGLRELTL